MSMPKYEQIMRPLLNVLADNKEHRLAELIIGLVKYFKLTDAEKFQLLPSGKQEIFVNRVGWAKTYMQKAGLISTVSRGVYKITALGKQEFKSQNTTITTKYLRNKYPQIIDFIDGWKNKPDHLNNTPEPSTEINDSIDPIETIENEFNQLNYQLANDLLDKVIANPPQFFENLIADLLIKMGYGSSREDILKNSGHSGDGGIDGVIKEDILGFDKIYVQAKRWGNTIGSKEIRDFVGALQMQNATKGLFVTTSKYAKSAIQSLSKANNTNIILIDGIKLAELMIKYNVGVTIKNVYKLKHIDEDYFIID
ncbi:MAG: restriction system protein [Pseudomonadota bacterium]|nr:restriction system protein [Pseudomonadota bacterium]